jgi:glycosyltransferase involved in cell wall biosynthesis
MEGFEVMARTVRKFPKISIIVPLYNEETNIAPLHRRILGLMKRPRSSIEAVLVDDGSRDSTPRKIARIAAADGRFTAVFLSRNFGHQRALSAGLTAASGTEAVFMLDGDLQDPPEMLPVFLERLRKGADVVYGIRKRRKERWWKRACYALFYRILSRISDTIIPLDSGDFCLISRRAADLLIRMPEERRFLRGMRSWLGFRQVGIPYERDPRASGRPKYNLRSMVHLAMDGIFNFSELPVRFMTFAGASIIGLSSLYFIYTVVRKYIFHGVPQGFTMLFFAILMFGGVQLLSLGILGEYVLRIFFQVKGRPHFIISGMIRRRRAESTG